MAGGNYDILTVGGGLGGATFTVARMKCHGIRDYPPATILNFAERPIRHLPPALQLDKRLRYHFRKLHMLFFQPSDDLRSPYAHTLRTGLHYHPDLYWRGVSSQAKSLLTYVDDLLLPDKEQVLARMLRQLSAAASCVSATRHQHTARPHTRPGVILLP
jgi:hypothetical protein